MGDPPVPYGDPQVPEVPYGGGDPVPAATAPRWLRRLFDEPSPPEVPGTGSLVMLAEPPRPVPLVHRLAALSLGGWELFTVLMAAVAPIALWIAFAEPGQVDNLVIAGHRITHGEPLRDMPDLEPGDEVLVETADSVYTCVLDTGGDDLTVDVDADWVLTPAPVNPDGGVQPPTGGEPGQRLLTLVTCAELFHTDDRLVAFGHLVDTRPR